MYHLEGDTASENREGITWKRVKLWVLGTLIVIVCGVALWLAIAWGVGAAPFKKAKAEAPTEAPTTEAPLFGTAAPIEDTFQDIPNLWRPAYHLGAKGNWHNFNANDEILIKQGIIKDGGKSPITLTGGFTMVKEPHRNPNITHPFFRLKEHKYSQIRFNVIEDGVLPFYLPGDLWSGMFRSGFLANFYVHPKREKFTVTITCPVSTKTMTGDFLTSEAAFHASKFPKEFTDFTNDNGRDAWNRKNKLLATYPAGWDEACWGKKGGKPSWFTNSQKDSMYPILKAKFDQWSGLGDTSQNPKLIHNLCRTGKQFLLEHKANSQEGDRHWSDFCNGKGENKLGNTLQELRVKECPQYFPEKTYVSKRSVKDSSEWIQKYHSKYAPCEDKNLNMVY